MHYISIYGFTFEIYAAADWIWFLLLAFSSFGLSVGTHRLYTHRSFKANYKLRLTLLVWQTFAVQNSTYEWVRDHRSHHKFTDTNADPLNSKRGFFFSYLGCMMRKKHPDVKKFGARICLDDLEANSMVMFQHNYFIPLAIVANFVLPLSVACLLGEPMSVAWSRNILRILIHVHGNSFINAFAHYWGQKPYDK